MCYTPQYWINHLQLQPHPEGGYFKENYRSNEAIANNHLPRRYLGNRSFSTAIYYLLENQQIAALHRIKSDEIWHFYCGYPLNVYVFNSYGNVDKYQLGIDVASGQLPQVVIPAGKWFGAQLMMNDSYILAGCTVAPGFDFMDFELAKREQLLKQYPDAADIIKALTHDR
ncbi:MAG: hypothetical protein GF313_07770 [Caldithrix sp.]|nr:hypothetical protein [Caldithrix sp.]